MCLGAAAACVLVAASAQADPRFYGGARFSITVSDVSATQEHDPRFGVGGGLFIAGSAWKSFDLRVEANYSQKGARLSYARSSVEWQMDYIDVPVLLVWNMMPKSKTSVELYSGASYGIPVQRQVEEGENLGYDLEDFIDVPIFINQTTTLTVHEVKDSDVGFVLGIGLSVPVGQVNFLVDARYTTGLTDPVVSADYNNYTTGDDDEIIVTDTPTDFSNRVFTFFVGFAFPFGARAAAESE